MEIDFHAAGLDVGSASLGYREHFALSDSRKLDFSACLRELGCQEFVILSTCNRVEVYWSSPTCSGGDVVDALMAFAGVRQGRERFYTLDGDAALDHLLRVAAGLESAVLGEDQILGQVRSAWEFAEAAGTSGKRTAKVFRTAVEAAKEVKARTGMSNIPLSASYIAVKKLSQGVGGLEGKSFLVIGAGEMSSLAVKYLAGDRAGMIYLCSRRTSSPIPESAPCQEVPFERRYEYLPLCRGVISATTSPHTVLKREKMPACVEELFIVDMAVPPDVDPAIRALPGVTLLDIDDLRTEAEDNLRRRDELAGEAEDILRTHAHELRDWFFRSRVDPALASLDRRCAVIAADTSRFLEGKLELSPHEKRLLDKMLLSSLQRLVREPMARLKALDDAGRQEEYIQVVKELFDL